MNKNHYSKRKRNTRKELNVIFMLVNYCDSVTFCFLSKFLTIKSSCEWYFFILFIETASSCCYNCRPFCCDCYNGILYCRSLYYLLCPFELIEKETITAAFGLGKQSAAFRSMIPDVFAIVLALVFFISFSLSFFLAFIFSPSYCFLYLFLFQFCLFFFSYHIFLIYFLTFLFHS